MPWVAQDDHYFHNPKARSVGPLGRELFSASWCYCSIQLNDGCFVSEDVQVIAALAQVQPDIADLLYSHDMWHPEGTDCAKCRAVGQTMPVPAGHVAVHEYLKQNKTREKVLAEREDAAERQRRHRASQRDSQPESQRTNGVTSATPSPPIPNDKQSSRRPGNSRAGSQPVDNPDDDENLSVAASVPAHLQTGASSSSMSLAESEQIVAASAAGRQPASSVDSVPSDVWERFAQRQFERQRPGSVDSPKAWRASVRRNASTELGDQAERWWSEFDVTPDQLAAALLDGQAPASHFRRKAPA